MAKEMPAHVKSFPLGGRRDDCVADVVPALFDMTMLKDESAIQAAIGAISCHLVDPKTPLEKGVVELHSKAPARVLELVLCAASHDAYQVLVTAILEGYQRGLTDLLSSPAPRLLSRFALCHWFLPDVCPSATANTLDATDTLRWKDAEAGTAVLQELSKLSFMSEAHVYREPSDDNGDFLPFGMKYSKSQGERKRARREKTIPAVDQEVFTSALKEYLDVFRRPEIGASIKSTFLRSPEDIPADEMVKQESNSSDEDSEEDAVDPLASSVVYPKKAARLFDTAEGFGEWRVFFTPRAIRDLRQARDGKLFNIFVKKIKELSNGHFSEDNQKRLIAAIPLDVPVYEAKMTGDTRLLYQVDCVKDPSNAVERQVLRIHGIYTHAQIDRRFWDAIRHARQLSQPRDAEHKKRCTFRNPPANPGDNVFTPATWRPRRATV
ncbi:hypothetical protein LXA43DRAFT_402137 [Ganoderma leucocontextum]|nr:hypothetical protein LXA43DRAFT_402137 [Ganoderma leucocontextum]